VEALDLEAQIRENKGKGYAKRLRRGGYLPCVLYGPEIESLPLKVEAKELEKIINNAGEKALIKLKVNDKEYITMIRELQHHPVKDEMLHADLYQVSLKEKLETEVPLLITGEAPGVKEGGVLQQFLRGVEIRCLPTNIPDYIEVDVSNLEFGESITVGDLKAEEGIEILTDPATTIVSVVSVKVEEEPEEAEAEEEAEEAEGREETAEGGKEE